MQARLISTLLATAAVAAATTAFVTSAAAQGRLAAPETARAASGANGIWKTTNGGAAASTDQVSNGQGATQTDGVLLIRHLFGLSGSAAPASAPSAVTAPAEGRTDALTDGLLLLRNTAEAAPAQAPAEVASQPQAHADGLMVIRYAAEPTPGEPAAIVPELPICAHCSSDVAQQSAPAPAAAPGQDLQSGQSAPAALLVPAVQQVRIPAARPQARGPQMDGVVVLATEEAASAAPSDPEMPICGHCGSDVALAAAEPAAAQRQRRRGGFSISIGGVSIGSGGVSVATGDINGSGNDHAAPQGVRRQHGAIRPVRESGGH